LNLPRPGEEREVELSWTKKNLEDDEEQTPEEAAAEPLQKFSPEEIQQLSDHFKEVTKDNEVPGVITRPQFMEAIEFVTHSGPHMAERLFMIFDGSSDEQIDFDEFRMAMHVLCRGSPEERLAYVFQAYDKNGDGTITRNEMYFFLLMANRVGPKEDKKDREELKAQVDEAFSTMDLNLDGALSLDECTRCMKNNTWIASLFDKI